MLLLGAKNSLLLENESGSGKTERDTIAVYHTYNMDKQRDTTAVNQTDNQGIQREVLYLLKKQTTRDKRESK